MRAVVQCRRQSADPCAAPPTKPFIALLIEPRVVKAHARFPRCSSDCGCVFSCRSAQRPGVLLTQYQANLSIDLSRFPQLKPLFQLSVPINTTWDLSQELAASVAAEQSPGLVTARGSFETLCPSRGVSRNHTSRECHRRGPAKLGEQLLKDDVPEGAVRKRAVVQRFSCRHWLRALRKLPTGCRTAGRCVLMPGLSSATNAKFADRSAAPSGVAPATALRSDSAHCKRPPSVDAE